jgi:hypothetical protein
MNWNAITKERGARGPVPPHVLASHWSVELVRKFDALDWLFLKHHLSTPFWTALHLDAPSCSPHHGEPGSTIQNSLPSRT